MSGGIFGLVGSLFGGVLQYFQRSQEQAFKKETWDHEKDLLRLNMEAAKTQTDNELAIVSQAGRMEGMNTSIQMQGKAGSSYKWVNAIRSLFRPFLTTALIYVSYLLFKHTDDPELHNYIVMSLVFATSTAIVWWFGDRAFTPPGAKNR